MELHSWVSRGSRRSQCYITETSELTVFTMSFFIVDWNSIQYSRGIGPMIKDLMLSAEAMLISFTFHTELSSLGSFIQRSVMLHLPPISFPECRTLFPAPSSQSCIAHINFMSCGDFAEKVGAVLQNALRADPCCIVGRVPGGHIDLAPPGSLALSRGPISYEIMSISRHPMPYNLAHLRIRNFLLCSLWTRQGIRMECSIRKLLALQLPTNVSKRSLSFHCFCRTLCQAKGLRRMDALQFSPSSSTVKLGFIVPRKD
ncbi:hypothetical protein A0H81_03412 [Grifola frondosa]|uniref:Uncharacterized protein n=1 Tax=Grifola frondosa TaxID=5627 RepID=A0A1C7MHS2_GRIFR|nr:hypothetical protein A0H81_03412 [Grifola frondosa]